MQKLLVLGEGAGRESSVAESLEKVIEENPDCGFWQSAGSCENVGGANSGTVNVDDFSAQLEMMESQAEEWVLRENGEIVEATTDEDRARVLATRENHAAEAQEAEHKLMKRLELARKRLQRRLVWRKVRWERNGTNW